MGTFDLLADYAQRYSVAVVGEVLGVPRADTQRLLDWSHAIVKMYELSASDELKTRANSAAGEFIDYTRELIAAKRRSPDERLVSQLVQVSEDGERLSDDEIVSTTMVLLEAGHEATVNTMGNGMKALLEHRDQWRTARLWRGGRGHGRGGAAALGLAAADVRPLGAGAGRARSPASRWPWASRWRCCSVRPNATRAASTTPTASTWRAATRATLASAAASTSASAPPSPATSSTIALADLVANFPDIELAAEPVYHPTFVIRGLTELRLTTT